MRAVTTANTGFGLFIQPTGKCFDDALDFIEWRLRHNVHEVEQGRLTLVHAIGLIPDGPQAGELFAHAWVEEIVPGEMDVSAWQSGFYNGELIVYAVAAPELYLRLRVVSIRRYSIQEAWEQNKKHGTYGPWGPELQALTKGGKNGG